MASRHGVKCVWSEKTDGCEAWSLDKLGGKKTGIVKCGQCMDWTTHFEQCPRETNATVPNLCSGYDTCSDCHRNPACGWCDEGQNNGLGLCHEGGVLGPLKYCVSFQFP